MSVYVIAQLSITDRAAYDRYLAGFTDVMRRHRGEVLAADEHPSVEEGVWEHEKLVLLSFPDEAAAREWAGSPAYRAIAVDRRAGSHGVVLLAHGVPAANG